MPRLPRRRPNEPPSAPDENLSIPLVDDVLFELHIPEGEVVGQYVKVVRYWQLAAEEWRELREAVLEGGCICGEVLQDCGEWGRRGLGKGAAEGGCGS